MSKLPFKLIFKPVIRTFFLFLVDYLLDLMNNKEDDGSFPKPK
jgi:hypothetical protein